jgi:hypothetical protein
MLKVRVGPYLKVGKNVQKFDAGTGKNDPKVIVKLKKFYRRSGIKEFRLLI